MDTEQFRFAYDHGPIRFGAGCVAALSEELAALDADRALVVAGETVGTTEAVVCPVREGLGDCLAGVFAGTTPEKRLDTAFEIVEAVADHDADALVGLGGGSSIDLATVAEGVVDAVVGVRDALDLPARLRDVDGPEPEDFPAVAEAVVNDGFMPNAPPGLDPTADEIHDVLEAMW